MEYNDQLLVVDDDKELLKIYGKIFKMNNFDIITVSDSFEALEIIRNKRIGVVVLDIIMPGMDGMVLLQKIREENQSTQVIMLTAEGSVSGAVEAVRAGAFTYLMKPTEIEELLCNVQKAFTLYSLKDENSILKQQILEKVGLAPLIGENIKIQEIRRKIVKIAATDTTVLITGESGTGKEILANLIHYQSNRAEKPFIRVNCAALTESLLESELFGHERGAFTGAEKIHRGKFEIANNGTILLDEIGELSINTQAKLLRVLQEREFERVGGSGTIKINFRLIASTNKNLLNEVEKGNFRSDLFYRINVMPVNVPPLRERKDDIGIISNYFLGQLSKEMNRTISPLTTEIIDILNSYDWPGNVRELKNIIERLVVMAQSSEIRISDIPGEIKANANMKNVLNKKVSLNEAKKEFEKHYIIDALNKNDRKVASASILLGIAQKNLYKKIKEYNIKL
ncbi:MAG TPA: sigma-54 dependent transcriptional regulator [Clostridia bacterium]|nr:sigma-54 dependent transcriptional regulator [Clostridia bacterium]